MLGTVGQLFPGLDARRAEAPEVAEVKGRPEMAGVVAAAVRDRQQVPRRPVELVVEQQRVRLDRDLANAARSRARRSRRPHNEAKRIFHREAVRLLAEQVARNLAGPALARPARRGRPVRHPRRAGREPGADPRAGRAVADAVAEQLLTDLFADRRRLDSVARRLPAADRELLARPAPRRGHPRRPCWTPADVPLLDEAAELLGDDGSEAAGPRGGGAARGGHVRPGRAATCSTSRRTSTRSCCAPPTSSTPTGSPSASGCAATTPPRTGRRRTASGPTAT